MANSFLNGFSSALVLGDNFFYGNNFSEILHSVSVQENDCHIFGYPVSEPERYGIIELSQNDEIISIEEKPAKPRSNIAITGLYFLDGEAPDLAAKIIPSNRGELEITDLLKIYLKQSRLKHRTLGRGFAWMDMGTPDSLLEASSFIKTIQNRQGLELASIDEIVELIEKL